MGELDGDLNEKSVFLFQKDGPSRLKKPPGIYGSVLHALGNEQERGEKSLGQLLLFYSLLQWQVLVHHQ